MSESEGKPTTQIHRREALKLAKNIIFLGVATPVIHQGLNALGNNEIKTQTPEQTEEAKLTVTRHRLDDYKNNLIMPPFSDFAGSDNGASIKLDDERIMLFPNFVWQGELTEQPHDKQALTKDSMSFLFNMGVIIDARDKNATATTISGPQTAAGENTALFSPDEEGTFFQALTPVKTNDELCVFLSKQDAKLNKMGSYIAVLNTADKFPSAEKIIELPQADNPTTWGAAIVQDKTHTFIYGTTIVKDLDPDQERAEINLARVAKNESLTDYTRWEFWNGIDWIPSDPSDLNPEKAFKNASTQAINIVPLPEYISPQFTVAHVEREGDQFVLVSTNKWTNQIEMYTAKTPQDLWTKKFAAHLTDTPQRTFISPALLHPEIIDPKHPDKFLLTYATRSFESEDAMAEDISSCSRVAAWVDLS